MRRKLCSEKMTTAWSISARIVTDCLIRKNSNWFGICDLSMLRGNSIEINLINSGGMENVEN